MIPGFISPHSAPITEQQSCEGTGVTPSHMFVALLGAQAGQAGVCCCTALGNCTFCGAGCRTEQQAGAKLCHHPDGISATKGLNAVYEGFLLCTTPLQKL